MKRYSQQFWLWLLASIGALACAPENEEPDAEPASDAPPEAGDNGPPAEVELPEAEFNADEEADAERGPDDDEEEEDEEEEPEQPEDAAPAQPAPTDKRPAPADAIAADDDDEIDRDLKALAEMTGQPGETTTPFPLTPSPAGQPLPLPPQGFTWALSQTGQPYLMPLGMQVPQNYPHAAPTPNTQPEFDPDQPLTYGEFIRLQQQSLLQSQQQSQRAIQQAALQARGEQIMEGHLDKFALTRNKNGVMRDAVRGAINRELAKIPHGWTDEDFTKVAGRVTQQFYIEANRRKGAGKKPAAEPAAAPAKPRTEQARTQTQQRNVQRPKSHRDEIKQEEQEIRKFLTEHRVPVPKRRG